VRYYDWHQLSKAKQRVAIARMLVLLYDLATLREQEVKEQSFFRLETSYPS
jgi:hypothetical protein